MKNKVLGLSIIGGLFTFLFIASVMLSIAAQKATINNEPPEAIQEPVIPLSEEEISELLSLEYTQDDFTKLASALHPSSVVLAIDPDGSCIVEIDFFTGNQKNTIHIESDTTTQAYLTLFKFINEGQ